MADMSTLATCKTGNETKDSPQRPPTSSGSLLSITGVKTLLDTLSINCVCPADTLPVSAFENQKAQPCGTAHGAHCTFSTISSRTQSNQRIRVQKLKYLKYRTQ